ncbi:DcaP family trimeric outer membrane transporter [Paraflavitalea sp. CAU 1676]|uniref:DcaP family trimeric outer membrane transporter n=1 Tax=Paraflavitalea sp. CAU 1676 TaxID=3032598 RepID=UPI0023DA2BBA|nr:DcaP family trimeric outer membrane transporter [Paraflavitalea sp. CAU 1676]MDF2189039.1 DcaP family trimeric outer membrane transporter [Paraflavitalea sp. CAU 1676]
MNRLYMTILLLFTCNTLLAQEQPPEKEKGKGITRNDIESGSYEGLVFTDVRGIRLRFNGFVQADFIHDFNDMANKYGFQPSTITVPTLHDANTVFSYRQSRFAFTALGPVDRRGRFLKAVLEFDLWGNNTGNPRLRHAYIEHGKWILGQTFSNFMNANIWPNIVDFWGPNAIISIRQPQLRFTQKLPKQYTLSVSVEQPGSDIILPLTWEKRTVYPDVTAALQKNFGQEVASHLRLAALLHPIDYKNGQAVKKTSFGYAGSFSGSIALHGKDDIRFQVNYGKGFSKFNEGISGQGYDAYAKDLSIEPLEMLNYWAYYDRYWNDKWGSAIGWSSIRLFNTGSMGNAALRYSSYTSFNTTYYFTRYFKLAGEVLYGERKINTGERGNNVRLQFTGFIRF